MSDSIRDVKNWRLWWFAQLEAGLKRRDGADIREALKNLARLGIEVRFTLPLDQLPPEPEAK